ncbi:MAG: alpha/beta fold hydrolase [Geminicoccaceae bacterium]
MHLPHFLKTTAIVFAASGLASGPGLAQEGSPLGYETHGSGTEKVIVLHDWLGSSATWDPIKPYLDTDEFTYVFTHVRGYGTSQDRKGNYTTGEITSDVFALADALGFDRFHLIGHSMTGMAGFNAISAEGSDRIQSFVAVTPTPPGGYPADEQTRQFFAAIPHDEKMTQAAFDGLTSGRYGPSWAEVKTRRNLASSTEEAMRGYGAMVYEDLSERLVDAAPQTPTRVIAGAHDLPDMKPDALRKTTVPLVPNAELVIIEGAGHYPMDETPILLVKLIEAHLKANTG